MSGVDTLYTATMVDPKILVSFLTDLSHVANQLPEEQRQYYIGRFFDLSKNRAASPEYFFQAFNHTRHLVLLNKISSEKYLEILENTLKMGLNPEEIRDYIQGK